MQPTVKGQGSRKFKFQTSLNGKTNGANMLALSKHAKLSTVTSSSGLRLWGQRSKKGQISNMIEWQNRVNMLTLDSGKSN